MVLRLHPFKQRDWYFIAERTAPAPHLAHPEGCAAQRIVLVSVPRINRSCAHIPDGFDLLHPFKHSHRSYVGGWRWCLGVMELIKISCSLCEPLWNECGTHKTGKAVFWPLLSGQRLWPESVLDCPTLDETGVSQESSQW